MTDEKEEFCQYCGGFLFYETGSSDPLDPVTCRPHHVPDECIRTLKRYLNGLRDKLKEHISEQKEP